MKPWMRQHQATAKVVAAPSSTAPAAPAAAPTPKPRTLALPVIGAAVFVYGMEHDGLPLPATVTAVNADTGEINVTGGRRNGQPFGETHVKFLDKDEGPPEHGAWALGTNAGEQLRPEPVKAEPAAEPAAT